MRSYYRYDQPRPSFSFGSQSLAGAVKVLLIVNAVVYLVGLILDRALGSDPSFASVFGYSFAEFRAGRVWQPFTFMFVHAGFWHFVFNMLGLFFFGSDVERRTGPRHFILFYLACGLGGAVLGSFYSAPLVGASAAVYGVLIAFAAFNPDAQILLFFILPIKARYVAIGFVFLSVVGSLSADQGTAHLAHLGGVAVAVAWIWGRPVWVRLGNVFSEARFARRQRRSAADQREMDRILAKVHDQGIHSLSGSEKGFLNTMSRKLDRP